jgi:WD40 repeat protein
MAGEDGRSRAQGSSVADPQEDRTSVAREGAPRESAIAFISYAREDQEFARRLAEGLELRSVGARGDWLLTHGENYEAQLEELQLGTDVLIFVISPESIASQPCGAELRRAVAQNQRVLPVLRRDSGLDEDRIPPELKTPQWTYMRESDDFIAQARGLVDAINTDFSLMPEHRRLLQAANTWVANGRGPSYLLRKDSLKSAEAWLEQVSGTPERLPRPTPLQLEYMRESRASRSRAARISLAVTIVVAAALLVLAIVAFIQRNLAESARKEAERQRNAAFARQVAAEAELLWATQPQKADVAALAAIEASRRLPTLGTDTILHQASALLLPEVARLEHRGVVNAAVFSPRGDLIATASGDKSVRIFDSASRRLVRRIDLRSAVLNVAFDPTGKRLATAGADAYVRVFEVATGKESCEVLAPESVAYGATFSPDGTRVAIAATYERLIVFEAANGKRIAELDNGGPVFAAGFSRDGRFVATGSSDGSVHIYSLDPPVEQFRFPRERSREWSEVRALAFDPSGRYVAAGGDGGVWTVPLNGGAPAALAGAGRVTAISAAAGGITVGNEAGEVRVYSPGGTETRRMQLQGRVNAIVESAKRRLMATASRDGTARVFAMPGGEELLRLPQAGSVQSVAFSPDGRWLLTGGEDGTARIYSMTERRALAEWEHRGDVRSVAISPDGRFAASAGGDGELRAVSLADGRTVAGNRVGASSVSFDAGSGVVAVGLRSGGVRAYDLSNGELRWRWPSITRNESANEAALATAVRTGGDLAAIGTALSVTLIRPGQNEPVNSIPMGISLFPTDDSVRALAFSPDGRSVAIGSAGAAVQVFSTETGEQRFVQPHGGPVNTVAFSPNSGYVIAGDQARTVWVAQTAKGESRLKVELPGPVYSVNVNSDSTQIAAGLEGEALVLDAEGGAILKRIPQPGFVRAVAFTADGSRLITVTVLGRRVLVHSHPMRTEPLIDAACRVLTRNLTVAEWQALLNPEQYRRTCPNLP